MGAKSSSSLNDRSADPQVDVVEGLNIGRGADEHEDEEYELDDVLHSLPPPQPVRKKGNETMKMIAGIAGNVLEWYDFAVFGYFSKEISLLFFPPQEGNIAVIETFMVFGAAFLMRPIGGMILGYIGDNYGRKKALELSIFLMAFPTFSLGILPTYNSVGALAIVLLAIVRLLQGLSVGGQLMSSLVFTVESKPKEKWGLYGSYVMASANIGTLSGNVVSYLLHTYLTEDEILDWGWRVPFLLGILASLSGFYLKYFCDEDELHGHHGSMNRENPIKASFKKENRRALISASLVPMVWCGCFYVFFVWMAIFMESLSPNPVPDAFEVNCLSLFFSVIVMFPFAGILSDVFGRTRIMRVGAFGILIFSPLFVHVISLGETFPAFCAQTSQGIFLTLWGAPMCAWLAESFKPELRLTAVSIGYNIAQALIGGTSAAVATLLLRIGPTAPGFFCSGLALCGLLGLYVAPEPQNFDDPTPSLSGRVGSEPEEGNAQLNIPQID